MKQKMDEEAIEVVKKKEKKCSDSQINNFSGKWSLEAVNKIKENLMGFSLVAVGGNLREDNQWKGIWWLKHNGKWYLIL